MKVLTQNGPTCLDTIIKSLPLQELTSHESSVHRSSLIADHISFRIAVSAADHPQQARCTAYWCQLRTQSVSSSCCLRSSQQAPTHCLWGRLERARPWWLQACWRAWQAAMLASPSICRRVHPPMPCRTPLKAGLRSAPRQGFLQT